MTQRKSRIFTEEQKVLWVPSLIQKAQLLYRVFLV